MNAPSDKSAGHSLRREDAVRIGRSIRWTEHHTREGDNITPGTTGASAENNETTAWPVIVTGIPEVSMSYPDRAELRLGTLFLPDLSADPPWEEIDCWVRGIPDHAVAVGDAGLARLIGWRDADDTYGAMPIYVIVSAGGSSGVYGQAFSTPGELVAWNDESGQWIRSVPGVRFIGSAFTGTPGMQFVISLPWMGLYPTYDVTLYPEIGQISGVAGTIDYNRLQETRHSGDDVTINGVRHFAYFNGGSFVYYKDSFRFNSNAVAGTVTTEPNGSDVVRKYGSNFQNWMKHYALAGTAGVSGTLRAGATIEDGIVTNLGTLTSAYTVTNVSTDRSFDANSTTIDEVADVLGTLIADLKAKNILG